MRLRIAVIALLLSAAPLQAQPPLTIEWDQPDATPMEAQTFIYRMYLDDLPPVILEGVTCKLFATAPVPTQCKTQMPPVTHGIHRVYLTGQNDAGISPPSPVTEFRFPLPPNAPKNLRIVR